MWGGKRGWRVRRGRRGLIRIFLSQRDDLHCRVNVPGSHRVWGIFQPQKKCWRHWRVVWRDLLSYGEGWGDFCLMAWGLYEVMRGLAALVFLPPVPGLHHWWVTPALSQLALGRDRRLTSISVFTRSFDGMLWQIPLPNATRIVIRPKTSCLEHPWKQPNKWSRNNKKWRRDHMSLLLVLKAALLLNS